MAPIPIFDGTNYRIWSAKMKTLFESMGLWDTVLNVDGNQPDRVQNAKALFRIQQGVSDGIFPIIEDAETAKEAWDRLQQRQNQRGQALPGPPLKGPDLSERAASHLIVATLVATVAFTAGFTMPGGYNSNDGLNQGMAILTREAAFKAFMVTDTIAMSLSISAVLIHFYATMPDDESHTHGRQVHRAAHLIRYAVVAMVLAFVTGTYAVLAHSSGLAISVCVIGCLPLFFFLITRIIKYVDYSHHQIL